ncbi:MAG: thermonuclease family protein [Armatimonadetes bacterium]|nr:thermonuclease family protein [Armatimonadota bacterium]
MSFLSKRNLMCTVAGVLLFGAATAPSSAGDSTYGTITEVKAINLLAIDCGAAQYTVRLIGIDAPQSPALTKKGVEVLNALVLKHKVQMRFEYRNNKNEMVSRILTLANEKGEREDAGEVLVRAGLAKRQDGFDYKCGCLIKAEKEAIKAKRGIWATK